jgi:two-component system sensor histidine kinase BarA
MTLPRADSISVKILLVGLPPILLLALILSAYVVNARLGDVDRAFHERGEANAREMASTALLGLFTGDRQSLQAASLQHLQRHTDLVEVVVRDAAGIRVAQAQRADYAAGESTVVRFSALVEPPFLRSDGADPMASPIPIGEVVVGFSDRAASEIASRIVRNAVLITSTAVLVTLLLAVVVARQIVRPLLRLRRAVRQMSEGDFDVRVPETTAGEIGELEAGINTMADAIAMSTDQMQREVDQATSDLRQTMDALEIRNIELDFARKRALAASAAKSAFLANMSHEIRTPMNGVLGFAQLLRKSSLDDSQQMYADTIIESANTLMSSINEILDFSKLEAGKLTLERMTFSLREIVDEVSQLFGAQAQDKGIELESRVEAEVPDGLIGDATRLRQILNNLVENAVKFTTHGGVSLRVESDRDRHGKQWLVFVVTDSGIGIAGDRIDDLFRPFSQGALSTTRLYGGTGLGLSICRSLAEAMGGDIDVRSEEGSGACFSARLPFDLALDSEPADPQADGRHGAAQTVAQDWLVGRVFLVADDNPINRQLVEALLSSRGGRTISAGDGQRAVELALSNAVDIAFVDVHMPRLDGIEAAARIHAQRPRLPIVAVTADATMQQKPGAESPDFFACLIKPIDEDVFFAVIADALGLDRLPRARGAAAVPALPGTGSVPIRDRLRAIRQAAGSESIADALFHDFLAALPTSIADIDAAHTARDWEQLWQAAHRLRGAAATCSLPLLHDALAVLGTVVREKDVQRVVVAVADVHREAERLQMGHR